MRELEMLQNFSIVHPTHAARLPGRQRKCHLLSKANDVGYSMRRAWIHYIAVPGFLYIPTLMGTHEFPSRDHAQISMPAAFQTTCWSQDPLTFVPTTEPESPIFS